MDIQNIRFLREKLRQLELEMGWRFKEDTECCGVTLSQCHTLIELGKRGELSIVDLAAAMGLDTSTLSRTINGMVNIGLVNRILNPNDRRYVLVTLTEHGKNLYEHIENIYNNYYSKVFEFIPEEKHQQVLESFLLVADAVRKYRDVYECCECKNDE